MTSSGRYHLSLAKAFLGDGESLGNGPRECVDKFASSSPRDLCGEPGRPETTYGKQIQQIVYCNG